MIAVVVAVVLFSPHDCDGPTTITGVDDNSRARRHSFAVIRRLTGQRCAGAGGGQILMFFYGSKILFLLIQPSLVCLGLLTAGLLFGRQRLAFGGLLALLTIGFSPLGNVLTLPLEARFARPTLADIDKIADRISGIIILGGFEDAYVTNGRRLLSLNEAAERLTEAMVLARRVPKARVVFSGGSDSVLDAVPSVAPEVAEFLVASGIAANRLVLEAHSRNTRENATMTYDLVKPKPGERWVLVTSAFHMPRSVGLFRAAGFDVVAWPVDYRTGGSADVFRPMYRLDEGVKRVDMIVKEYVGLLVYRLRGWTAAVLPGPL
jgi:uncharacterized SAM-binding protein YcdF (DUF218 family)